MARKPTVGYWPGPQGRRLLLQLPGGRRHELALGPRDDDPPARRTCAALDAFKALLRGRDAGRPAREAAAPRPATAREVLDEYLKHISKSKEAGHRRDPPASFEPFVNHVPEGAPPAPWASAPRPR